VSNGGLNALHRLENLARTGHREREIDQFAHSASKRGRGKGEEREWKGQCGCRMVRGEVEETHCTERWGGGEKSGGKEKGRGRKAREEGEDVKEREEGGGNSLFEDANRRSTDAGE
jgi:hypothetical protein